MRAATAGVFVKALPGKRVGMQNLTIYRVSLMQMRDFRMMVQVIKHTIDKQAQRQFVQDIELKGWSPSLDMPSKQRSSRCASTVAPTGISIPRIRPMWLWAIRLWKYLIPTII